MEMHQVRYFLAIAKTLNFTRAAELSHVSQPSLTAAIKKLEAELGGELFRRERKFTHLTDLGKLIKPHLEQMYAASEAAKAEAESFAVLDRAEVDIGVMSTINPTQMIGFLTELNQKHPTIEPHLREGKGQDLIKALLDGEIDIGLVSLLDFPSRLHALPLYSERYMVAFAQGHRFERETAVPFQALDGEDYLVRLHCEFTEHFEALGFGENPKTNLKYSSEREDWIQAMVLARVGCTVMPEFLPSLEGVLMRPVVDPQISRTVSLVTVAGRQHTPAVAQIMRLAQTYSWHR